MTRLRELSIEARGLRFPAVSCGEGPLVLCLHGFPDCLHSFDALLPLFAEAGYRAVAPALRGYAPSCMASRAEHNALEAARDAVALVSALGAERAHLVGHDWGAVATYLAAQLAPATFRSLCTLAVPHPLGLIEALPHVPTQLRKSWYMFFFQTPFAAEALAAFDFALVDRLWRDWSPGLEVSDFERDRVKATLGARGVAEAALDYYRNMFDVLGPSAREARRLLSQPIAGDLLALTGQDDGCLDTRVYDFAASDRWFRSVVVERMRGVGHFLHQEEPERVSARLVAWFDAHG